MKKFLFLTLATVALAAPPAYKVVNKIKLGGGDRWDYSYADTVNHRLYVSHGTQTDVIDTNTDMVVGTIAGKVRITKETIHSCRFCQKIDGIIIRWSRSNKSKTRTREILRGDICPLHAVRGTMREERTRLDERLTQEDARHDRTSREVTGEHRIVCRECRRAFRAGAFLNLKEFANENERLAMGQAEV